MAADADSTWIAKSRAQKAAEAIALNDSQRRAKIRLLCLPPVSAAVRSSARVSRCPWPETCCSIYAASRIDRLSGHVAFPVSDTHSNVTCDQAGTGAWVYQNWWKSLPEFVEVSPAYDHMCTVNEADATYILMPQQQRVSSKHPALTQGRLLVKPNQHCTLNQPLNQHLQVLPIELPGRALRMKEDRHTCIYSLVHSMLLALSPVLQ